MAVPATNHSPGLLIHQALEVGLAPRALSPELLRESAAENKLLLLFVGAGGSALSHSLLEQFSPQARALLHSEFLFSVVETELRPDVTHRVQRAAQLLGQPASLPLVAVLNPARQIFFAAPAALFGAGSRAGLESLLQECLQLHKQGKAENNELSERLAALEKPEESVALSQSSVRRALSQLRQEFDASHGGFGAAAKSPQPELLQLLLEVGSRTGSRQPSLQKATKGVPPEQKSDATTMALFSLDQMAKSALYDQLGGGFFVSTLDAAWQQPIFEKKLADNAALLLCYLDAYQLTEEPSYRRIIFDSFSWIFDTLSAAQGGYFAGEVCASAQDKRLGQSYFFSLKELEKALGKKNAQLASEFFEMGNQLKESERALPTARRSLQEVARSLGLVEALALAELQDAKTILLQKRASRAGTTQNDLILSRANALMLKALSRAASIFDDEEFAERAERLFSFFQEQDLKRVPRCLGPEQGEAELLCLSDVASWIDALCSFAEAFQAPEAIARAETLLKQLLLDFADEDGVALLEMVVTTGQETHADPPLGRVARRENAGNAQLCAALLSLYRLTQDEEVSALCTRLLLAQGEALRRTPAAQPTLLRALLRAISPTLLARAPQKEATPELLEVERALQTTYLPALCRWGQSSDDQFSLQILPAAASDEGGSQTTLAVANREELAAALPRLLEQLRTTQVQEIGQARILGRASKEGCAQRTQGLKTSQLHHLPVSALGVGLHRMGLDNPLDARALETALRGGINLLDTSPSFAFGDADRLIARVLAKLKKEEQLQREEVVVVSRAGVFVGEEATRLQERCEQGASPRWTVPLDASEAADKGGSAARPYLGAGAFSLEPELLKEQIRESRNRLGLECIDFVLLQSPERLLCPAFTSDDLRAALTAAFAALLELVEEGLLQGFGVFSSALVRRSAETIGAEISLDTLLAARSAAGAEHVPFIVELPLNLYENEALKADHYESKRAGVVAQLHAQKIEVLAARPLSALAADALFRLVDPGKSPDGARAADLGSARYRVASLEAEFDTTFAAALRIAQLAGPQPVLQFSTSLGPKLEQSVSLQQFQLAETTLVSPSLRQLLAGLDRAHQGPGLAKYLKFKERYIQAVAVYLATIREAARDKNRQFLRRLLPALEDALTADSQDPNESEESDESGKASSQADAKSVPSDAIFEAALLYLLDHENVSATMVGLRKPEYVEQALALLRQA